MTKYLNLIACLLILFNCACIPTYKPHQVIIQDDYVEIKFGRKMSRELLDSIRTAVSEKGINLSYPEIIYDGNKLTRLEIQVIAGNQVGHGITNFVFKGKPFGFRVDNRPTAQVFLKVGELE